MRLIDADALRDAAFKLNFAMMLSDGALSMLNRMISDLPTIDNGYEKGCEDGIKIGRRDALNDLVYSLNIGTTCDDCPRHIPHHGPAENYRKNDLCKGHLYWLCKKFREALNE